MRFRDYGANQGDFRKDTASEPKARGSPPRMTSVLVTEQPGSNDQLNQKRAFACISLGEEVGKAFTGLRTGCFDAHPSRELGPIQVGIAKIQHVERSAARISANISKLAQKNLVFAVRQQDGGHIKLLARLGP